MKAKTKIGHEQIFKEHGVRWLSLHRLPYGDPVRHTLLGLMHNWIQGILEHHSCICLGIGIKQSKSSEDINGGGISRSQTPMNLSTPIDNEATESNPSLNQPYHPLQILDNININIDSIYKEFNVLDIDVLADESRMHNDSPSSKRCLCSNASAAAIEDFADLMVDETNNDNTDFQPRLESDDADWEAACVFTKSKMARIHNCLADAVIPSWIDQPPTNLGEKSHGKIKADQWFILFSVFLPLILPEIWVSTPISTDKSLLLDNFYHLVTCTNIVCAYLVTPDSPEQYLQHNIKYQKSSEILFQNTGSHPNHHYAMHNADLMKFWGPLVRLGEFAGEQHNGNLQNIKTNNHQCEFK